MIIIINGPLGVGKSTISEALLELLRKQNKKIWLLDVDHLMTCEPALDTNFGPAHYEYLTRLVSHNINFHCDNGFDCFIINYVFGHQELADLMYYLHKKSPAATSGGIFSFCLWSLHSAILILNVSKRSTSNVEWEQKRCVELHQQMTKTIQTRKLGEPILIHDDAGVLYKPEKICTDILAKIDGILNSNPKLESMDFNPRFIDWILSGSKKATTRKFSEERLRWKLGVLFLGVNSDTKKPFAVLRLDSKQNPTFGELSPDLARIENFESVDEFKQVLRNIYPDINETGDSTPMQVFHFTVVHHLGH
jgi:uncharacterized protein YqfB (UPF0267 family)